jgi:ribosomal protein S18 acetylase RimI-like enzyme
MTGPSIREMRYEEYQSVLRLWEECGLPCKPHGRDHPDKVREEMKLPQNIFLVAVVDDEIIGSVLVTHDGRKGWINRLSVLPDHRNRGIAKALMAEAERWLLDQGIGLFACFIEGENPGSASLLTSLGYVEFEGAKYYTKRTHPDI